MQLRNIVLVLAAVVVAVSCAEDEYVREVRHASQYNYNRDRVLPTWKPTYHHTGGSPTYRVRRDTDPQNTINIEAVHKRGEGEINAQYNHRLWTSDNGNMKLDAYGNYNQGFNPHGRGRDYGGGINFSGRF